MKNESILENTIGKAIRLQKKRHILNELEFESDVSDETIVKNKHIKKTDIDREAILKKMKKLYKEEKKIDKEIKGKKHEKRIKEVEDLVRLLDVKRSDNYTDWLNIGFIIANECGEEDGFDIFNEFSKRSKKYDKKDVSKKWKKLFNDKEGILTIASLKYYVKLDNPLGYCKLMNTFDFERGVFDTASIAGHFKELYGEKFIFNDGKLYVFNGVYWEVDNSPYAILNNLIKGEYFEILISLFHEYEKIVLRADDDGMKVREMLDKKRKQVYELRNFKKRENYIKDILCDLTRQVEFDTKPHLFAFINEIWDLDKGRFVDPNPLDYVSMTCGYAFDHDYNKKKIKEVSKLLESIFPEEEIRKFELKILATCLYGVNLEKFIVNIGGGGNGKGVLNELLLKTVGNYGYVLPVSVLLQALKTGCNPEIANLNKRRVAVAREPDKQEGGKEVKIKSSVVKELTGGSECNARLAHSNITLTILLLTLIMECNDLPNLDESNDAMARRIEVVPFNISFVDQNEYNKLSEDDKKNVRVGNGYYKTPEFKNEYKQALFMILAEYFKTYREEGLKPPKVCDDLKRKYLEKSDEIFTWVNENSEKIEGSEIKLVTLFNVYKMSESYTSLSAAEKRTVTKGYFVGAIQKNFFLKKYIATNKDKTLVLKGYQLKEIKDEDEEVKEVEDKKKYFQ